MKREELEIQQNNVTVSQFLAYVRSQIKKHGLQAVDPADIDIDYFKAGNDLNFDYHDIPGKPCKAEKSVSKPYEMQTYIRNWDGTAYNLIMEFNFYDEKTGNGYFYFLNTWKEEEETETREEEETNSEKKKGRFTMYSKILEYFQEKEDVFNETIEELDSWNGYLGDDRYYSMDEMNDLFSGQSVEWILCRAFFGYDEEIYTINSDGTKEYGPFNPCRDYFSFNGYGNFVSADCKDYSAYLDNYFIESLIENRNYLYLNDEVVELLDDIENDDDDENE